MNASEGKSRATKGNLRIRNKACGITLTLVKITIYSIIGVIVVYISLAVAFSVIPSKPSATHCQAEKEIYIVSNGVHLDLIMPKDLLTTELQASLQLSEQTRYVAFGWGDAEFYINTPTWADIECGTTFRALFTDSQSALHIVRVQKYQPEWISIQLCEGQLQQINRYIENTFKKNTKGRFQEIQASGYSDLDSFYMANGNFSLFHTCNNWVNAALKHAGVKTSMWSPFDKGVLYHLDRTALI